MKKLAHQQAGDLGEALALAKLNSLGYAAYASPTGAPGHDLMVVVNDRALSVEVKTRQFINRETEITRWPVLMAAKGDADLFLFVALNITNMAPTFYLLTNEQARKCHRSDPNRKQSGNCLPSAVRAIVAANDFGALQ
ncbi:hypothetical protein [Paracoccus marinaquae]|uniref:Protein NO VEIN C-terminal domain-containing protein n=1 Tax=Paracoccus marinaquae TaxID=2841926 RepID=A0ABS6AQ80_9RHOB|nr:hypothetical protein [Paracoccus marinaquae]MBU3032366.1 hypothetical protein [Paracoccus marinaquae]